MEDQIMNIGLILEGKATLEDLQELHDKKGIEVVIENGKVTAIEGNL